MKHRDVKEKERYSRIDYDKDPDDVREEEQNEETQNDENDGRPYRRGYRPRRYYRRGFRRFNRRFRKPFAIEVVLTEDATTLQLPERKTSGSAGADLKALTGGVIPAHGMLIGVRTGIKIKIPNKGTVGWITPRSGMSKVGITIINSPGEIDSDYRGELLINFANLSDKDYEFNAGDRIAQITFTSVRTGPFNIVPEFSPDRFVNTRGEGGFGSTDKKDIGDDAEPVVTEN